MFEPNTTFLICSDGITRHITDDEINALLFSAHQPADICQRMKEICYERGAEDNLTAVIVRVLEAAAGVPNESMDFEQDTIATARPSMAATAGFSDSGKFESQSSLQNLASEGYETQKMLPENQVSIPAEQPKAETFSSEYITAPQSETDTEDNNRTVISYDDEKSGGGIFGKLIGGLALLLLGMAIGAFGYSMLAKKEVAETPVPVIEEPEKEENLDIMSFENLRREVDLDPAKYIKTAQAVPSDAEDFYLLGRAQLLAKNYPEAKKNFTEAKNRLASVSNDNSKMLATEIALGLAVINGQFSLKEFEKELPAMQTENANINSANANAANSNTNSILSPSGQVNGADIN